MKNIFFKSVLFLSMVSGFYKPVQAQDMYSNLEFENIRNCSAEFKDSSELALAVRTCSEVDMNRIGVELENVKKNLGDVEEQLLKFEEEIKNRPPQYRKLQQGLIVFPSALLGVFSFNLTAQAVLVEGVEGAEIRSARVTRVRTVMGIGGALTGALAAALIYGYGPTNRVLAKIDEKDRTEFKNKIAEAKQEIQKREILMAAIIQLKNLKK